MSEEYGEKRRFPRLPSKHVVLVKKLGDEELEGFAKTMTVGPGGCMFISESSVGVGSAIELLISVRGRVVQAQGRVVYELATAGDDVQVGVEFLKMRGEDMIVLKELFVPQDAEGEG